jgi:fructose-bisphosphate aldolase / 2-amino-3,7-dideoxy-D-threo-hept-6-ulosonate synthase
MSNSGKKMRLRRIFDKKSGNVVMFAASHGTSTGVVLSGLENIESITRKAFTGGADIVFLSTGMVNKNISLFEDFPEKSVALKLSSSGVGYEVKNQEVQIFSVEHAVKIGADAVVVLLPFSPENEVKIISWLSALSEKCYDFGMPLIAEAELPTSYSATEGIVVTEDTVKHLKRICRLSAELGADIVKTNWTGSEKTFNEIIKVLPVPVVVAGGSRESDIDLLTKIELAIKAGARGCSVGRNIFQHKNPIGITRAISAVTKDKVSAKEAISLIQTHPERLK